MASAEIHKILDEINQRLRAYDPNAEPLRIVRGRQVVIKRSGADIVSASDPKDLAEKLSAFHAGLLLGRPTPHTVLRATFLNDSGALVLEQEGQTIELPKRLTALALRALAEGQTFELNSEGFFKNVKGGEDGN